LRYQGKTAVITGAASGIGQALAVEVARKGASLAISDVDGAGLKHTAALCSQAGRDAGKVVTYDLDVADRQAVLEHAEKVAATFGSVNMVFNNAGVAVSATVLEMSFEDLDWLLGIDLYGVINATKAFLPHLIASGDGNLINISSVFGLVAPASQSAYCTAKFGVRGFTEALRQEMIMARSPVTVHCVHPGGVRTNIVRSARLAPRATDAEQELARQFDRAARTTPEKAAQTILAGVERNKARILVGPDAYLIAAIPRLVGAHYEAVFARLGRRLQARGDAR
jgi:NAD(P)-dependent dehydrogenase (short-subunit alcohol dehydrogenase family)